MKVTVKHPKVKDGPKAVVDLTPRTVAGVSLVEYTNEKGVVRTFRVKPDANGEGTIWVNRPISEKTLRDLEAKDSAKSADPAAVSVTA